MDSLANRPARQDMPYVVGTTSASFQGFQYPQFHMPVSVRRICFPVAYLTHQDLMRAGNIAYMELGAGWKTAELARRKYEEEIRVYQAKEAVWKKSYDKLADQLDGMRGSTMKPATPQPVTTQALSHTVSGIPFVSVPSLRLRQDAPLVKFWTRTAFQAAIDAGNDKRKSTTLGKPTTTSDELQHVKPSDYLETDLGVSFSKEERKAIFDVARKCWQLYLSQGNAPKRLSAATSLQVDYYRYTLGTAYPSLLCAADYWKLDYIWSTQYSSWHTNATKKSPAVNNNTTHDPDIALEAAGLSPKKRKGDTTEQISNKKSKVDPNKPISSFKKIVICVDATPLISKKTVPPIRMITKGTVAAAAASDNSESTVGLRPCTAASVNDDPQNALPSGVNISARMPESSLPMQRSSAHNQLQLPSILPGRMARKLLSTSPLSISRRGSMQGAVDEAKSWTPPRADISRNRCARDWKKDHPQGSKAEFDAFYLTLSKSDRSKFFRRKAKK